jgi:hypothetical protein
MRNRTSKLRPGRGRRKAADRGQVIERNLVFLFRRQAGDLLKQIAHDWRVTVRTVIRGIHAARALLRSRGRTPSSLAPAT